jgi:hypothetical protein
VLVVWLAWPTIWWTPLNVDEELTIRLGDYSLWHILQVVSTKRGGGPLHFWLEQVLLGWSHTLPALRLPSLVFLCVGLVGAGVLVRRLAGEEAASAVVLLTAASPIPVLYATFGRPHTLLFAWLMWSTVVAILAAERADRRLWVAAGALLGLSVFVHPTAPLYALTAFAAAVVYAPRPPRTVLREVWPGAVALLVTFVPYYAVTLHVLSDRYGVGSGAVKGRTFNGKPVWEDALHYVAPGSHDLNRFTLLAVLGAAVLLMRRQYRLLGFCALTVAAPVVFFSVVPASGDSALFFDRYMIPVTPAFLTVVAVACVTIASLAGRFRLVVLGLLVAALLFAELRIDLQHRRHQQRIGLDAVTHAVAALPRGGVLFGSTGTSGQIFSSFDYGHPANIIDRYLSLRVPGVQFVDDDSCERALPFLRGPATPRYGIWVFYAASADEAVAASARLHVPAVDGHYFVIRSARALPPRGLIRLGQSLRRAWRQAVPSNRRVDELLSSDRQLLAGTCVPYGELGDPDISPHWPPARTTHQ